MSKNIKQLGLGCAMLGSLFFSTGTLAETMLSAQELLGEPSPQAAVTVKVKKGDNVKVLQKKGFWVEVEGANGKGWTKLNAVKAASGTTGLASVETGRLAKANIVSSSGVRGLDGGDLEQAEPDTKEFDKLTTYAQSSDKAKSFAKTGKLQTRDMAYLKNGRKNSKKNKKK